MPNTKNAIGYPTEDGGFEEMGNTAPKVNMTADDISYDNSQSGASATNVQAAVDEAFSDLSELSSNQLGSDITLTNGGSTDVTVDLSNVRWLKIAGTHNVSAGTRAKLFYEIPMSQFSNVNDTVYVTTYAQSGYNATLTVTRHSDHLSLHLDEVGWTDSWTFKLFG